jgi:nicotinate phosphoribosyltransferase
MHSDVLTLLDEANPGNALLEPVMRAGRRLSGAANLAQARRRAEDELARLPDALRELHATAPYPVHVSQALRGLADEIDRLQVG